jgi:nidogen-like
LRTRIFMARLFVVLVIAAIGSLASGVGPALAEGPNAVQNLPGCATNTLTANDDNSTGPVALPFALDFHGDEYSSLFVNNNGNVTFDAPQTTFTPFEFHHLGDPRMIAPFLADVDTGGAPGDGSMEVTYGNVTVDGKSAFCVNWIDVGYFGRHVDKLNSFQLLLIQQGTQGDFDIVFNYDKVQWETGDASGGTGGLGGTPAAVGWSNGDGEHFYVHPGSFSSMALLDSNPSTGLVHGMLGAGNTQLGRYVFEVRGGASGPALEGHVEHSTGGDVVNGPVEICPVAGGPCRVRNTNGSGVYRATGLASGTYEITAYPPADSNESSASTQATMAGTDLTAPDLVLGPGPQPPPAGTTVESIDTTPDGIPVVIVGTSPTLQTEGCPNGTARFEITVDGQVIASGALTESPAGSGQYSGQTGALNAVGDANVTITIDCGGPPETVEFGLYIDPSGHVRDSNGAPIADATVELFRSPSPAGPFVAVPDGSAIMSPSNRINPDLTDATGHFGWDVVAGYYKVRASKDGCVSNADRSQAFAESHVMTIPPPVTDLDIRLYCGEGGGTGGGGGGGTAGGGGGGGGTASGGSGTAGGGSGSATVLALASFGKIKLAGGKVVVPVFCASAAQGTCAGSVTIKARSPKKTKQANAAARSIKIGSARFSGIAPGKTKQVKVKLNRKGRALLRKGKLKGRVSMKVRAGSAAPQTIARTVTLSSRTKGKKG